MTWLESEHKWVPATEYFNATAAVVPIGEGTTGAAVVETHVSILFFIDDRVYKLRKHIQFGFLDFSHREARHVDCEREVALNRRLAPDVYLGVADVQFAGKPIDHMVVMRRLPEERRLAALARQGDDLEAWVRQVAEAMDVFHRNAQRSPAISSVATRSSLQAGWDANFSETKPFLGTILDPEVDREIRSLVQGWIGGRRSLFDSRVAAERICDGHGDLQAEDIFCLEDGVRILDCVEFSDQLRYGDVCADVAFLAMDLERLGRPESATQFLDHYQDVANDRFPSSLVHYYIASRAYVRAKVACLRAQQGDEDSRSSARQLHLLGLAHLRGAEVKLILIGGLPGSGKSTVAAGVGSTLGYTVLRSDEVRLGMFQATEEEERGYRLGRYTSGATAAVYNELIARAENLLRHGESVILDASWVDARWRSAAQAVSSRTESGLVELCCHVGSDIANTRIVQRLLEHRDVSEATPEVRAAMQEAMDPWPSSIEIDTGEMTADKATARALNALEEERLGRS